MAHRLDLGSYTTEGVGVLAGRERGEAVRDRAGLPRLDAAGERIEVVVPDYIFSINSSFFLGLFGDSIRSLGEKEFRARYHFEGEDIDRVVEDGIRQALRTSSPLRASRGLRSVAPPRAPEERRDP